MSEPISGYRVGYITKRCPHCGAVNDYREDETVHICGNCRQVLWTVLTPDRARRDNDGKLRYSLVDFASMGDLITVLEYGAERYGRDNWKRGLTVTSILDSMLRHITAYLGGEDTDPESGLPHVGHIYANAMFLARHAKDKELDDREVG